MEFPSLLRMSPPAGRVKLPTLLNCQVFTPLPVLLVRISAVTLMGASNLLALIKLNSTSSVVLRL